MQWLASESSVALCEGAAPLSMPKYTTLFGSSSARDDVSEQSALRHSTASGTALTAVRMFSSVCVTSP